LIKDNRGNKVFRVKMRALNLIEKEQIAFSINTDNEELWHKRLGHFHHVGPIYM
jgi:hypothetical protein